MDSKLREIIAYKHYFPEFFQSLPKEVQEKFVYFFRLIQTVQRIPEKFLKHLEGTKGLYEIRVMVGSNIYRAFCCFDKGNLVILFNAFHKKSQKTPPKEIELAEKLMNEYFDQKKNQ
ncbi:MAG TPA: addiction module toxin RelE [Runella sp.]|nr:addiction module toxin RelE [Runella sp.]